jgi:polar amino acid transport system substrate-binding protein
MAVVLMMVAMFVAACGGSTASVSPSASADTSCAPENLALKTPGVLTLSTNNPAYSPWFQGGNTGAEVWVGDYNNDPANGEGYEGAVAYAIAEKLGFTADKVTWIVTAFEQAYAPGEKAFDLLLNQVSIKADRAEAVDFSNGYYNVAQGVVTVEGSPIAGATSIAELKGAKLGTEIGTTSYDAIINIIQPDQEPAVFNSMDEAVAALDAGLIDGIVADVPTTFYMRDAQLSGGVIVGQLASTDAGAEQFGVVLQKGSSLTACVNRAVDALKADGTLDALLLEWIGGAGSAPVIE